MEYDIELTKFGTVFYYKKGTRTLHREDGPAIQDKYENKWWYIDGCHHREDGPAIEYANGTKEWWVNGKRHKTNGPAVEYTNGIKEWWVDGQYLPAEKQQILNKWWKNKNGKY